MQDSDTTTNDEVVENEQDNEESGESNRDKFGVFAKKILQKLVLFVSFGPGVLGVLWLLGRILKR
ncbi:MAG TPA: hypothetical protein V6C76_13240 [Drouetiella sp.]